MLFYLYQYGIFFQHVFPHQGRGIIIGQKFYIYRPALQVAAIPDEFPGSPAVPCQTAAAMVHALIQMTGIPFMGKGSVQLKVREGLSGIDIDYVIGSIVQRRCQIKGGRSVVF